MSKTTFLSKLFNYLLSVMEKFNITNAPDEDLAKRRLRYLFFGVLLLSALVCSVLLFTSCGAIRAGYDRTRYIQQYDSTYFHTQGTSRVSSVSKFKTMKNFRGKALAAKAVAPPFERYSNELLCNE